MPKVIEKKPEPYGSAKYVCPKCKAVHLWKFPKCQNLKCGYSPLEKVKCQK